MTEDHTDWKRMRFKSNKVWMALDKDGNPEVKNGKLRIKYQLNQTHEYWVHPANVHPIESAPEPGRPKGAGHARNKVKSGPKGPADKGDGEEIDNASPDTVYMYTDGASSGNPGPSGIGVVLSYGGHRKEISSYIGHSTNNVAELEAIRRGLMELKNTTLPVRIFTDSAYAYGLLSLGWKAKKNQALVGDIIALLKTFTDVRLFKVKGHAGHPENERADFLATSAIKTRHP